MPADNKITENQAGTVQTGVRVPADLWLEIKRAALESGTTAQQISIDAMREWLCKNKRAA